MVESTNFGQTNGLQTWVKVVIGMVVILIIGFIGFKIFEYNVRGTAQGFENDLKFEYKSQENVYSNNNKMMEMSGLTVKNYGETVIKAIQEKAKQYEGKPELMTMFISEKPTEVPSDVWKNFTDRYEKYTQEIKDVQDRRLSLAQSYGKWMAEEFGGRYAKNNLNFPTPEGQKLMDIVISTQEAKTTFITGVDKEVKSPF